MHRLAGFVAMAVVLSGVAVTARAETPTSPRPGPRVIQPNVPVADFDGDGLGDLAVGADQELEGGTYTGAVFVLYGATGSGSGILDPSRTSRFTESDLGLTISHDFFGSDVVAGDFNGDHYDDLAVTASSRPVGGDSSVGQVFVLYGSATGLTTSGMKTLQQGGAGATDPDDKPEADDDFGAALAAGDFGGGPQDDLAVGSDESVGGMDRAGSVSVFFGSSSGLKTAGHQFFTQKTTGIPGSAGSFNHFGSALAGDDLGGSSRADLVIGAPRAFVHGVSAGIVIVLQGSNAGLTSDKALYLRRGANLPGTAAQGDLVGSSVTAGDFGKGAAVDLAIGAPGRAVNGDFQAGEVIVVYGSDSGLDTGKEQVWTQKNDGTPSASEGGDLFGYSLAAANYGHSSQADLVIGMPGETLGSVANAGAAVVLYGTASGLSTANARLFDQESSGILGVAEDGDVFGLAAAGGELGNLPFAALMAGVPGESVGSAPAAGAVNVILGGSGGLSSTGNFLLYEAHGPVPDQPDGYERFGFGLAA